MARKTIQEYNKAYYAKHRDRLRASARNYYQETKKSPLHRKLRAASARKSRIKNRDKIAAWNKDYYKQHKADYYSRSVSYRYGLSPEEYVALVQKYPSCGICARSFTETRSCIDHDHNAVTVRGLLCKPCNVHLGWFEKYGDAAVTYLGEHARQA